MDSRHNSHCLCHISNRPLKRTWSQTPDSVAKCIAPTGVFILVNGDSALPGRTKKYRLLSFTQPPSAVRSALPVSSTTRGCLHSTTHSPAPSTCHLDYCKPLLTTCRLPACPLQPILGTPAERFFSNVNPIFPLSRLKPSASAPSQIDLSCCVLSGSLGLQWVVCRERAT